MHCTDSSVDTSAVSAPHKRPRLELVEEEEEDKLDPLESDLSVIVDEPRDVTHDPLQSVTLTESTDVT